jgi:cysteinyl-tRNA synthetase
MLRIHDTRLKRKVPFEPREPGKIGMYVCGITVYDLCHVGHARSAVAFDVIARYLRKRGFQVKLVKNITDVDDKIIRRAQAEGRTANEVAETYIQAMADDFLALGLAPPDSEPRATQHIDDVIGVVKKLEERGLAYPAGGDVYYAVGSFANYGSLSGQSTDELKSGVRIEVDEHKRSPLDFALWKGAKPGEPAWDSPWGPGRPGWHIECSAMCWSQLGESFDLHGGGTDLIFPHHENEIAQSEGAFGPGSFSRHWLHNGMVNFGGEKMSKSLGNVVSIRKVAETHDLEALRLLMVSVHYRSPVTFTLGPEENGQATFPDLDEAESRLEYFYRSLERLDVFLSAQQGAPRPADPPPSELASRVTEAMDDDFNTAAAIGHLYDGFVLANKLLDDPKAMPRPQRLETLVALRRDLADVGAVLGIMTRPPSEFLLARRGRLCARRNIDPAEIEGRIADRVAARGARDFTRADEIRAELKGRGVELMDTPAGTTWRVV